MKTVFADTAFYIAAVNPRDALHRSAQEHMQRFRGNLFTTEYVLVEVGNFLSRASDRALFSTLVENLRNDPNTIIIPGDHSLFEKGLELYTRRRDKAWSFTDCTSFLAMQEHGITDALTGDRHFEQAGFKILLK